MTLPSIILLFFASILAGTLNAVAGGGSFITVPALIFTHVSYIQSNTTNTVALWPGSMASTGAYRREITAQQPFLLFLLISTSLVGGILGAILLLHTSQNTFKYLLPYLLLVATLLFTLSPLITKRLRARSTDKARLSTGSLLAIALAQFIIAVYGGYFGGGIGILMLATLAFMGMENIHVMNGIKTLLASCINGVAVITFVLNNAVLWPQAILMIVGAIIGGYGGAYYARKIEQKWIRLFVIVVGFTMTVYFFVAR